METILLSNIGNRNIRFDGLFLDLKNNSGKSFKECTKEIFEQLSLDYDLVRPRLTIEILPNFTTEIKKIILFATDQDGHLASQDTVYEAEIIKMILEKEEGKKVSVLTYTENPADEFSTYRYFSNTLREFKQQGENVYYLVNDAGGTPHMKQALKDLCEFFFTDRHKIVYTNQQDQKHDVNRWYAKKYTILTTIAEFIKNYDYRAASFLVRKLYEQLNNNDVRPLSDELMFYIEIVANRINFDRKKVEKVISSMDDDLALKKNKIIEKYIGNRSFELFNSIPFDKLSDKGRNDIFEIGSICQLYFNQHNYTYAVATLYRFMEEVCQCFIESEGIYKINTAVDRNNFVEKVSLMVRQQFKHLQPTPGLPFFMAYVSLRSKDQLKNLISIFIKLTSHVYKKNGNHKGINILRNACFLAHDNKPITKEVLNKNFPDLLQGDNWINEIFTLCNLPTKNIYDQMNDEILTMIYDE